MQNDDYTFVLYKTKLEVLFRLFWHSMFLYLWTIMVPLNATFLFNNDRLAFLHHTSWQAKEDETFVYLEVPYNTC